MLDRLNRRYSAKTANGVRFSRAEHVKSRAGFHNGITRVADYIALDVLMTPASELTSLERAGRYIDRNGSIHGHEVKVSRSDFLMELKDPSKALEWSQHCHYWWLVAPDHVVKGDLPEGWGWLVPYGYSLRVRVKAKRRDPIPMIPSTLASLGRAIAKTEGRLAVCDVGMATSPL